MVVMITRILLSLCLFFTCANAESIKSTTGNIIFDINNDGTSEAKLTSDGLAIGAGLSPSSNLHVQGNVINTGDLVIGGTAGNSTLEVQGAIGYNTQTISSNTTLSGNSVILVDTSSDNVTVTLPYAGNVTGRLYTIKKTSTSNEISLNGGGNNIDSGSSYTFSSGNSSSIKVISNGSQWFVLSMSGEGLSVNGTWTPSSLDLEGWWDASDSSTITESSGDVSQWDDKSGNGLHLTQGTGSAQPTTDAFTINGLNVIHADTTEWMVATRGSKNTSDKVAYFAILERVSGASSSGVSAEVRDSAKTVDHNNIESAIFDYRGGNTYFETQRNGAKARNTNIPATGVSYLFGAVLDGTNSHAYVNGTAGTTVSSTGNFNWDNFYINTRWYTSATNIGDYKFAEIILMDVTVSTSDRQKIEGYLAHKWGLEANLPAGHPYKSSAP